MQVLQGAKTCQGFLGESNSQLLHPLILLKNQLYNCEALVAVILQGVFWVLGIDL